MVEVYKVGVTFALKNLISAELLKMAGEFASVDKAAKSFAATLKTIGGLGEAGGVGILTGMSASAKGMGESFSFAAAEIDGVRQKLNGLKQVAASAGSRNTGFFGSSGGFAKTALEGAGAYGAFEALKSGMSMEDTIARAMIAMGMQVGPNYMTSSVASGIQNSIFDTSTGFGINQGDTQEAALQAMRSLAPLSSDQRMSLLPSILKFAGAEVLGKHGTTMEEATEAGIALAHQLRAYTPEQIEPLLGAFAKLSMASPASLSQMARASSYYLPLLTSGLNMDPTELMAMGTVGSQMGLNTKSGTWLSQMFQAPFVSDLTSKRQSARRAALQALGLVDGQGKPVTKDAFEFLSIVASHASSMTPEERMRTFVAGFGQQGARGAAIFTDPAVMNNLMGLASGLHSASSPDQLKKQYGNSPEVQFDKAKSELFKTLTVLGEELMPAVTDAMKVFILPLKAIVGIIHGLDWFMDHTAGALGDAGHRMLFGGSSVPPPSANQSPIVIEHQTKLGNETIARSTTKYIVDGLATVGTSGNNYDLRMTPMKLGH